MSQQGVGIFHRKAERLTSSLSLPILHTAFFNLKGNFMPRTKTDEWGQNKHPLLAIICQQSASFADDLHEILSYVKQQEHIPKLPEANPKSWLRLYRNHRLLEKNFLGALSELGEFPAIIAGLYAHAKSPVKPTTPPSDKLASLPPEECIRAIYELNLKDLEDEFAGTPCDEGMKAKIKELLINQEFLFQCKVVLPCLLLYGLHPCKLLRRARLGDLKALEQLIRLDKLAQTDFGIAQQSLRLLHRKNKCKYEAVIARAVSGAPKFPHSRKQARYLLAGLISLLSEAFCHKLEEPDIRALFNAIAYDKSGGKIVIDTTLPDSPETFSKAIQRSRAFWKSILPDKTF